MLSMNTELIEGLISGPPTMEDASAVLELMNACDMVLTGKISEDLEDILTEWSMPGFSLEHDVRILVAEDGRVVGYGIVMDNVRPVTPNIDVYLHPELWGKSESLDRALLVWAEERARQAINQVPADARIAMHAYSYSTDSYYKAVLERYGMNLIRHAFQMKIDLETATPKPVWPEGITVRTFREGEDKRPVLEIVRSSFQDHWGYVDSPFDEHYQRWLHSWEADFDPSLWFLAMDGDQIAAICLCKARHGEDESMGWVGTLGVTRSYRRRGLAMALLLHAFDEFRSRGKASVGLGVDASSLTGATRLYEKAGMYVFKRFDLYEKELRPGLVYGTQSVME